MKWEKSSGEMIDLLDKSMAGIESRRRIMFGYPAYFINDNMFAGLFQNQLYVRLSAVQQEKLNTEFDFINHLEPITGRPMKAYFIMPDQVLNDYEKLTTILSEAAENAATLKPKKK